VIFLVERNNESYKHLKSAVSRQYGNWRGGFRTQELKREGKEKVIFDQGRINTISVEGVNDYGGNA